MVDESSKKQRLLIVDDSKVIRVTARKILQDHFDTVEAVDGENAWDLLNNSEPFSLVVSDLTMPNLDGFGLLERIRSSSHPDIVDIPVIIITGANDSEPTKDRATKAGATDFIGKPFDSVHLLARTQAHADAHTANKKLTKENIELEDQSLTDPLTVLANETAFLDRGYEQVSYAIRHNTSLAIFRIEVDNYGELSKQHGKDVTESIIKSVAEVLQSCIRQEDMAARIGPARFSLLLGGMKSSGIRNLAVRINRDISSRILKQGDDKIRYTVSIGVAAPEIQRDTRFEELLSIADSRLGFALSNGGNQVVHDESGQTVAKQETPAPEPVAEPIAEPVAAPVLTGEAISELSSQPAESVQAVADTTALKTEATPDTAAPVEALVPQESIPVPARVAVPDLSSVDTAPNEPADSRTTATALPPAFTTTEETVEDTIVITAPFDASDPVEQTESPPSMKTAPESENHISDEAGKPSGLQIPEVRIAAAGERLEDDPEEKQTGFFRRLFSPLARLFGRSR